MNLNLLKNKKIGILGLGIENQALVKYLLKHKVKAEITVCDARKNVKMKKENVGLRVKPAMTGPRIFWQLGEGFNKNLDKFDILFRAPGWPIDCPGIGEALKAGVELSSPMKLFFDLSPSKNIIGVTGTKGKGTTSSLIYKVLKSAGKGAWLGGNIGVAPFTFIDKIKKNDWVVLELSSFQLEDMTASPRLAVITNIYPEHLAPADPHNPNYHKTLEDYWGAKINIVKYQKAGDTAVLNYELRITNYGSKSKIFTFSARNQRANCFWFGDYGLKCNLNSHNSLLIIHTSLLGEHNQENIAAAAAVAKIVGVKDEIIKKAVANFKGLPHRLELARELNGVKYYDDSFATTPESTIIALKSFSTPVVLLLGGADKGAEFKELAKAVKRRVKFVVLLSGRATPRIRKSLLEAGYKDKRMKLVHNMKEAVQLAKTRARSGEVVLLSTACASFGMFNNYKERGDFFKGEVGKLK